jgi:hypothetical protein
MYMATIIVDSTESTFVTSLLPNTNFSTNPLLITGTDPVFLSSVSFIKFVLPVLPVTSVNSAILRLYLIVKNGAAPSPVVVNRVTTPFNTATVTFNTQPSFVATSSQLNITTADVLNFVQIDVTSLINSWLNGTFTNAGIALTDSDGTTSVQFASSNFSEFYVPKLILDFTEGPTGGTILSGVGAPTCAIGNTGDLYADTEAAQIYIKQTQPTPPTVRTIPVPTGNTLLVGSTRPFTTIQAAINAAVDGDLILLDAETFTITSEITVNKSVTIRGQGIASTTVITTTPSVINMFNITVPDVVISSMKIVQNFPVVLSIESVILINNLLATGVYIDNCEISICELGISIKAKEFQITNCKFTYAPLASLDNGNFYILISSTSGDSIISNNTFVSDSGNTRCRFIIITNISVSSGTLMGKLLINNNIQQTSPFTLRHLLVIEEFIGQDFELNINNNTTINEGNVPVLLFNADNSIFKFIEVVGNSIQNTAGKGLIGIDGSSTGSTDIFASGNTIANPFFTAGWASATVPTSFIVGYNTAVIPLAPTLPLASCYWLLLCCSN